jgi:hypothetical protein
MEQERCYVCRRPIPDGQGYRRVMPTAHYTGGNLGTASGVFSFTRSEVVSLCAVCDAAEARRAVWRPGWGLKAMAVVFVVTFCLSAFLNGYWLLGGVCTAVVLWRLRVRWRQQSQSAMLAQTAAPVQSTLPSSKGQRVACQPSAWSGDDDD